MKRKYVIPLVIVAIILGTGFIHLLLRFDRETASEYPTQEWMDRINEAVSVRTGFVKERVIVLDSSDEEAPETSVAASAATVFRIGPVMHYNPLLITDIRSDPYSRYLSLTDRSTEMIDGDDASASSIDLARKCWSRSDLIMIYSNYTAGLNGVPLASYFNIPMIFSRTMDKELKGLMDDLECRYAIVLEDAPKPSVPSMRLLMEDIVDINAFFCWALSVNGDRTDYILLTNPADVDNVWGAPGHLPIGSASLVAGQVAAYRKAVVGFVDGYDRSELGSEVDDLENYNQMGASVEVANGYASSAKDEIHRLIGCMDRYGPMTPRFVGLVGDPIGIPFHYEYFDPGSNGPYFSNTNHIASDYYYGDIEGDERQDIAVGRFMGQSLTDISLLAVRSLGSEEYNNLNFERGEDIAQRFYDTLSPDWKENAGVFVGTSKPFPLPGALKHMKKYHYDVLGSSGMFVTSEESMLLNDITADMVMDQMNYLMYCGHGVHYAWYSNRVDHIDATFVSNQKLKPGFTAVMACLTGRTDNMENGLDEMVSMSFLHAGLNAYLGSTRLAYGLFKVGDGEQGLLLDTGALYLVDKITEHFSEEAMPVGELLMVARNEMIDKWGIDENDQYGLESKVAMWEYVCYGDPAWTPAR